AARGGARPPVPRPSRSERPRRARGSRSPGARGNPAVGAPMTPLARLLAYFRPYRGRALGAFLAMAIVSLSTVVLLFLLTKIIDDVLGAGAASGLGLGSAPGKGAAFVRWLDSLYSAARSAAESGGGPGPRGAPPCLS